MGDNDSAVVLVRISKGRKKALEQLVAEGQFRSMAEAINTALTLLLDRYGKLGVSQPRQPRPVEADTGAAEVEG